ncbi:MAG: hypothetical protein QE274_08300, partial [Verrucomicrobiaceae bacterium]|nr:hypothetical protein [Verrucomicrobiaceae bacterium]
MELSWPEGAPERVPRTMKRAWVVWRLGEVAMTRRLWSSALRGVPMAACEGQFAAMAAAVLEVGHS